MKELHQVVSEKLTEMITSGAVEEIIAKNLTKTIEESVKEALRSYGNFGKVVSKKIEEAIMMSAPDINLPLYNTLIAEHINATFSRVMNETALSQFDAMIADILKPVPKESKFSTVMDLIRDCWGGESEHGSVEIESNESDSGEALYVTIKHPEYDWYNIKVTFYCFHKKTWHIGYLRIGDKTLSIDPKKHAAGGLGSSSLGDELFKYYLAKTEFEADEDFESIGSDY